MTADCRVILLYAVSINRSVVFHVHCRAAIPFSRTLIIMTCRIQPGTDLPLEGVIIIHRKVSDSAFACGSCLAINIQNYNAVCSLNQELDHIPRDALRCKARYWDRMTSVCLSVTLVDCDHIGWKSSKLIARTICPTPSLFGLQTPSTHV